MLCPCPNSTHNTVWGLLPGELLVTKNTKNNQNSFNHSAKKCPFDQYTAGPCASASQDGSVTLEEFISGLLTMKGPAKAIDVKTIAASHDTMVVRDIWEG